MTAEIHASSHRGKPAFYLGQEDIPHQFDLSGLKRGQWFFGCGYCWFQLQVGCAAYPECPECGGVLQVFNVTAADVAAP